MPRRPHQVARAERARTPDERPAKLCARCGRPFTWRRKWARDWDAVRYCSDRCRAGRGAEAPPAADGAHSATESSAAGASGARGRANG